MLASTVLPSSPDSYTPFHMTQEEVKLIESRMYPGKYSQEGFLAKDDTLNKICTKDLGILLRLKISYEHISDTLAAIIRRADEISKENGLLNEVCINDKFKVKGIMVETNGYQICPFHKLNEVCHKGRRNFSITNIQTNESISFSELLISLIGKHAFFEGNTTHRLDPEKVCRVLELKSGEYKKITEKTWTFCSVPTIKIEAEEAAKKYSEKIYQIDDFVTAYLGLPYQDHENYKYRDLTVIQKIQEKGRIEGKSEEQIKNDIQLLEKYSKNWDPNGPAYVETGKKYLHLFNHQNRSKHLDLSIDGGKLDTPIKGPGIYIFEAKEESFAEI